MSRIPIERDMLTSASWSEQLAHRQKALAAERMNAPWLAMKPQLEAFARDVLKKNGIAGNFIFEFQGIPEPREDAPQLVKSLGRWRGLQMEIKQGDKQDTKAHKAVGEALQAMMDSDAFMQSGITLFGTGEDGTPLRFPQIWGSNPQTLDYSLRLIIGEENLLQVANTLAKTAGKLNGQPSQVISATDRGYGPEGNAR